MSLLLNVIIQFLHFQHNERPMYMSPTLRKTLTTAQAAKALNRAPQTLRNWASLENGPIRPIRIHGRLAWPLDAIDTLLAATAAPSAACPHCGTAGAH